MNKIFLYIFIILSFTSFGQELNCNIVVNASQTGDENLQIFKTLESQISCFNCTIIFKLQKYHETKSGSTLTRLLSTRFMA